PACRPQQILAEVSKGMSSPSSPHPSPRSLFKSISMAFMVPGGETTAKAVGYHILMDASDGDPRPPWRWPRAAYVHIPFCAHHCGYCDFAVAVGQDQRIDAYLDALAVELSGLAKP